MSDDSFNNEIAKAFLLDHKRGRRWRNIRFIGWMVILLVYAILIFSPSRDRYKTAKFPYVSVVRLGGVIMPNNGFSAQHVIPELNKAFADKNAKGVILVVNSPGGSPVQAAIIHDKILQLKKRYHKKAVVVGEDVLASGAYLVAVAADKIYVNRDTITGSIGVIMGSFGFTGLMQKIGVTRRVFTAGSFKDRLDPFKPLTPGDEAKIKSVLGQVHQSFVAYVKAGRGDRLQGDPQELFSGDFWTGAKAMQYGLVDGNADLWQVMAKEFAVHHYRDYTVKRSLMQLLFKTMATELNLSLQNHQSPVREETF